MFTQRDLKLFRNKGLSASMVVEQLNQFRQGFPALKIVEAATHEKGIKTLNNDELRTLVKIYENKGKHLKKLKFVPASGAASRMFKHVFVAINSLDTRDEDYLKSVDKNLTETLRDLYRDRKKFAFTNDIDNALQIHNSDRKDRDRNPSLSKQSIDFFRYLLTDDGLNYANLPKGLMKFHKKYNHARTSVEEHFVEGALYARSGNEVNLHLTVAEKHKHLFEAHVKEIKPFYEQVYGVKFRVNFSHQESHTDRIAVDLNNKPFRDISESIVFRPGGHGALLENLNALSADIIFIKNIDNVVQDRVKNDTIIYKKALAGLLIQIQKEIFECIAKLLRPNASDYIDYVIQFVSNNLAIEFPQGFERQTESQIIEFLIRKLNRPIRVCGMVRNQGEPGGGPYWVQNTDNSVSLQIVESSQFNNEQKHLIKSSTHFNSVDIVCSTIDYLGNKFDLNKFSDQNTGFISEKSHKGTHLKALELPGLWNGAMANWNTIFVEVPSSTFAPVKTINDLLREEHLCHSDL